LDRSPAGFVEDNENGVRPFNVDDWEVAETGKGYNFKKVKMYASSWLRLF
jgi:hypothetical protein